jgi:transcriptional antiterminator RfaH
MTDERDLRWYLVYCKPRQEATARRNLERQRYVTYLPLLRELRRRGGRRGEVIAPLFPRYLFVRLNTETDNWAPIRSTLGVVSIVRFGPAAAAVPDRLVDMLRRREDADGLHRPPAEQYRRGARVRITEGGFAGYEGIFLARTGRDRVTVLLQVLGRDTPAQLGEDAIEPVG